MELSSRNLSVKQHAWRVLISGKAADLHPWIVPEHIFILPNTPEQKQIKAPRLWILFATLRESHTIRFSNKLSAYSMQQQCRMSYYIRLSKKPSTSVSLCNSKLPSLTRTSTFIYTYMFKTPTSIHEVVNSEKKDARSKTPRATQNTNCQWSWMNNQNVMTLRAELLSRAWHTRSSSSAHSSTTFCVRTH